MNEKQIYQTPLLETFDVQTETCILSNEGYDLGNPFIGGFEDDVVFIF